MTAAYTPMNAASAHKMYVDRQCRELATIINKSLETWNQEGTHEVEIPLTFCEEAVMETLVAYSVAGWKLRIILEPRNGVIRYLEFSKLNTEEVA